MPGNASVILDPSLVVDHEPLTAAEYFGDEAAQWVGDDALQVENGVVVKGDDVGSGWGSQRTLERTLTTEAELWVEVLPVNFQGTIASLYFQLDEFEYGGGYTLQIVQTDQTQWTLYRSDSRSWTDMGTTYWPVNYGDRIAVENLGGYLVASISTDGGDSWNEVLSTFDSSYAFNSGQYALEADGTTVYGLVAAANLPAPAGGGGTVVDGAALLLNPSSNFAGAGRARLRAPAAELLDASSNLVGTGRLRGRAPGAQALDGSSSLAGAGGIRFRAPAAELLDASSNLVGTGGIRFRAPATQALDGSSSLVGAGVLRARAGAQALAGDAALLGAGILRARAGAQALAGAAGLEGAGVLLAGRALLLDASSSFAGAGAAIITAVPDPELVPIPGDPTVEAFLELEASSSFAGAGGVIIAGAELLLAAIADLLGAGGLPPKARPLLLKLAGGPELELRLARLGRVGELELRLADAGPELVLSLTKAGGRR